MGHQLEMATGPNGTELVEVKEGTEKINTAQVINPQDAKYIILLDADSFLLPDYVTAMIAAMERPDNQRAAIMQTPYTAVPGTPHVLERAAGATTDIYYYVTEGMGFAGAGFWVGASAT